MTGTTSARISASVEEGVRTGQLAPGAALPPVRTLAARLGVSPATVAAAYQRLRDRGVVETAGRAGTRVRPRPPVGLGRPVSVGGAGAGPAAAPVGAEPAAAPVGAGPAGSLLDLSTGAPAADLLPRYGPILRRLAGTAGPANYVDAGPLAELVAVAADRLAADGVPAGSVTITGGALDGIERCLGAHLRPGDRVAIEDPGWSNLLDLVAALGLTPVPVPVDDHGPTEDGLRAALSRGVSAVVVTSRAQNPTGASVGATRARALRGLLSPYPDLLVIEDDHAAELAAVGPHPLAGATRHWAFLRSVSKPYGPDLRLAVLSGDEITVDRVAGRMRLGTGWVSTILQRLVLELWRDQAVSRSVERARGAYLERRQALRAALADLGVPAHGDSGINVWIPVAEETAVVAALRDAGYAVAPGALYRIASPPAIRITVAALPPAAARPLAEAVARALTRRGPSAVGQGR